MTSICITDRKRREQHGREDDVITEAETGVMWLQVKACQQPPEAGRGKERFSPRVAE